MKMTRHLYLLLIILLPGGGSIFAQSTGQATYETGDYKIDFPFQFEKSTQAVPFNSGQLLMTIASYEPKGNTDSNYLYMIIETTYPDSVISSDKKELVDNFFETSIQGAIRNVNGKLINGTKGMMNGYPARTIEIDYQNGLAIIKMTLVLRKSKMIMIQTITNTKNYPNSTANKFLHSFSMK